MNLVKIYHRIRRRLVGSRRRPATSLRRMTPPPLFIDENMAFLNAYANGLDKDIIFNTYIRVGAALEVNISHRMRIMAIESRELGPVVLCISRLVLYNQLQNTAPSSVDTRSHRILL